MNAKTSQNTPATPTTQSADDKARTMLMVIGIQEQAAIKDIQDLARMLVSNASEIVLATESARLQDDSRRALVNNVGDLPRRIEAAQAKLASIREQRTLLLNILSLA